MKLIFLIILSLFNLFLPPAGFSSSLKNLLFDREDGLPLVIAHRGASGNAPENTFASFNLALSGEISLIELDVRKTADGHLVVYHDVTLTRLTGVEKRINKVNLNELKKLSVSSRFFKNYPEQKVPTLEEVLIWAQDKYVSLVLDVKITRIEKKLTELLLNYKMLRRVVVISPTRRFEINIRQAIPDVLTARLTNKQNKFTQSSDIIIVNYAFLPQIEIQKAHQRGQLVWVWPVNKKTALLDCIKKEVDAVISDYPIKIKELIFAFKK